MGKMKDKAIVERNKKIEVPEYAEGEALLADGFEEALVGFGTHFNHAVAIYDYDKCLDILIKMFKNDADWSGEGVEQRDLYLEAIEYMDFNVTGGWVGPNTPVFLRDRRG